ncbi:MAG: hypothetical protein M3174_02750, partial [Actinomycetota bacterium]|nr:hypothetical protein [Actinomycetota bacterium]
SVVEDPMFRDIAYAEESDGYARATGVTAGTEVDLVGFVDEESGPPETFTLTRFYVSCCAADAIPFSVPVDPQANTVPSTDEWARVTGVLEERDGRLVVVADAIEAVEEPDEPYLY